MDNKKARRKGGRQSVPRDLPENSPARGGVTGETCFLANHKETGGDGSQSTAPRIVVERMLLHNVMSAFPATPKHFCA
jgi:hypothetical protein